MITVKMYYIEKSNQWTREGLLGVLGFMFNLKLTQSVTQTHCVAL